MYHKTAGIVLHSLKYGDNGRIVTVHTEAFGRTSFIFQGLRPKKGMNRATLLQPLFIIELEMDHRQGRDLQRARELKILHPYQTIPYDVTKSSQVLFLAELLYKILREEEARPELFRFLSNSFQIFDLMEKGISNFHLLFLIQFTRLMGFAPVNNYSEERPYLDLQSGSFENVKPLHNLILSQEESFYFYQIMNTSYDQLDQISLNSKQRNGMLTNLINYFSLHLGMRIQINSLDVFHDLFN